MAALVARGALDLAAFRAHLAARLPAYARPLFLRLRGELAVTATLKYTKHEFVREGFDPTVIEDAIYVDDREQRAFVRVDKPLYDRIQTGQHRF
jgi:fatty-acyl-CoA synthase